MSRFGLVFGLRAVLMTCAASVLATSPAISQTAPGATVEPPPVSAYGALPGREMVQLSPSGDRLAFITVAGEDRNLVMLDLATRAQVGGIGVGRSKVRDLEWVGENQLLIATSTYQALPEIGLFDTELFIGQIYDPARNRVAEMFANSGRIVPILMSMPDVVTVNGEARVLARAFSLDHPEQLNLYRIDTGNGRARLAETMGRQVTDHIMDPQGASIARSEYDPVSRSWSLYLRQGGGMRQAWRTTAPIDTPGLLGLGMTGDSVIVRADRPDMSRPDRPDTRYFDVNIETGNWRPLRFEFEPQGLIFHPVTRQLIGATRTDDEGRRYVFVDPQANAAWAQIERAFAGRSPTLVSWSDDFRKVVVATMGQRDAGTYYVADLAGGSVIMVGQAYEEIRPEQVGEVRPVSYDAADGLEIHGYLTLPPGVTEPRGLPLVVLPHGGPEAHDTRTFDYWAQAIASRGYAVLQPNFRGSTGYGQDFIEAGYGEWGRKMQTDLSDGVRWLAGDGVIDPARVCIVGASYGGYAALAGPTLDPGVYRCAVSYSGVSDLRRMIAREGENSHRRENLSVRYWNRFMGAERIGDRALDALSPAYLAEKADAPILLMHGKDDTVVPIEQSRVMAAALRRANKPHEFIELNGEDHWLSRPDTRRRMLEETLRFLQIHNPAD